MSERPWEETEWETEPDGTIRRKIGICHLTLERGPWEFSELDGWYGDVQEGNWNHQTAGNEREVKLRCTRLARKLMRERIQ